MGFVLLVCKQPWWEVIPAVCAPVLAQEWHRSVGTVIAAKGRVYAPASGLSLFPSTCIFFPFLPSFSSFRASCIAVSQGDHCLLLATSDAYQSNVASIKINSSSWSQRRAKLFLFFVSARKISAYQLALARGKPLLPVVLGDLSLPRTRFLQWKLNLAQTHSDQLHLPAAWGSA